MFANAYVFDSFVQDWLVSETCVLTNMFQDASGMINKYNAPATPTYTFFNQPTALNNWSNGNYNIYTVVGQWFADSSSPQFTNQSNSPYFGPITGWDTSDITNMKELFTTANTFIAQDDWSKITTFNENIGSWNVAAVTDMNSMFEGCSDFNQNISAWDVSVVTDMSSMFSNASSFNQNISTWNVDAVTDMSSMFSNASAFNQNIGNWDINSVTNMSNMFYNATSFDQDLNWLTLNVNSMTQMFSGATAFNGNISYIGNIP